MAASTPFTRRLKALRAEKGITQKQLAEDLNISLPSVINYENGQRKPVSAVLTLLAQYYNVSREYLLGESDDSSPYNSLDIYKNVLAPVVSKIPQQSVISGIMADKLDLQEIMKKHLAAKNSEDTLRERLCLQIMELDDDDLKKVEKIMSLFDIAVDESGQ